MSAINNENILTIYATMYLRLHDLREQKARVHSTHFPSDAAEIGAEIDQDIVDVTAALEYFKNMVRDKA